MSFKIYITNLSEPKKSIQLLMDSVRDTVNQSSSAVIQIDLSFPQAFPVTTDPEILSCVIEELAKSGIEKIFIVAASYYNIPARKIWNSLGFDVYISSRFPQVQFLPIDEKIVEKSVHEGNVKSILYPKIVEEAELFISLVNPKVSILSDLSLSVENSQYLLSYDERLIHKEEGETDYCEKDIYLKNYKQAVLETHFIRPPDLILYDFSCVLSNAGPILYTDSQFQYSDLLMISESSVIGDMVALLLCDKNPDENPLIEAIKNYDYSLVSQDEIKKCKITLIEELEDNIQETDLSALLTREESEQKHKLRFWKKKEKEQLKNVDKIDEIDSFIDIFDIFPQKVEICKGVMCSGCKKAAIELLLMLKTAMNKDQETIPNFSLLMGENPIEPEHEYCIVFGDHAIETTKERKFREKRITRTIRTESDIDLEKARLKINLQKKVVELESHYDFIKQEIAEGPKRDRAIKRLNRKITQTKRVNEYRLRVHDKYLEHSQKRYKKLSDQDKVKLNPNILEIPGCPPDPLAHLDDIVSLFKKRWVPGLYIRKKFLQSYLAGERKIQLEDSIQNEEMEMKT